MQYCVDCISENQTQDMVATVKKRIEAIRDGKVPFKMMILTKNLSRDIENYANKTEYLSVAWKNKQMGRSNSRKNEEVTYVFTVPEGLNMHNATVTDFAMDAELALEQKVPLHYHYYLTNHFKTPITIILSQHELAIDNVYDNWIHRGSSMADLFASTNSHNDVIYAPKKQGVNSVEKKKKANYTAVRAINHKHTKSLASLFGTATTVVKRQNNTVHEQTSKKPRN